MNIDPHYWLSLTYFEQANANANMHAALQQAVLDITAISEHGGEMDVAVFCIDCGGLDGQHAKRCKVSAALRRIGIVLARPAASPEWLADLVNMLESVDDPPAP